MDLTTRSAVPFHELCRCEVSSHGLVMLTFNCKGVPVCYPRRPVSLLKCCCFAETRDIALVRYSFLLIFYKLMASRVLELNKWALNILNTYITILNLIWNKRMLNITSKVLRHFKRGPQLFRSNSWTHWHSVVTNKIHWIYKYYLIQELCFTNCGSNNRLMRAYVMSGTMWDVLYASPSNLQAKSLFVF